MGDFIQLLPDHVANQIAAGEVVQRPASVVKELLENSIDAGANSIKLIVKDGGKTLIQVVDNGKGMSPTDARMSFERHATSKIEKAEDLFQIRTKGFRGEALASIAAIAHVTMQTRPNEDELGTMIQVEGSKVIDQAATATPQGTSIVVKNLFYNIPARRNFLKSDKVELRHITDEFHRVALAHPQVEFRFYHNNGELFNLPSSNLKKRIVHIFGRKTNEKLVPLNEDTGVVAIEGFILKPEYAKKSRGEQFFFVNDRFIKNSYLHHAVVNAFEGLLREGTFPGYFIYLKTDPSTIDINIHPTKTEIKFEDEHSIYAILRSTIKHSLGQFNVAPALDFESDPNLQVPYSFKDRQAVAPGIKVDPTFNPFKSAIQQKGHGRLQKQNWESLYVGLADQSDAGGEEVIQSKISRDLFPQESPTDDLPVYTLQFRKKYILATIESGMVMIHQSRAHQRILYEQLLKQLTLKESLSQQLLFPIVIDLNPTELQLLKELKTSLEGFGFKFGNLGEDGVEITGIPPLVSEGDVGVVLDEILAKSNTDRGENFSQADGLAKVLCNTLAVKSGRELQPQDQLALVNDLFACKEAGRSPFQKPVFITISEKEIEKKFN